MIVVDRQILRGTSATVDGWFYDQDGEPVGFLIDAEDPEDDPLIIAVTVTVTRGDGTAVVTDVPAGFDADQPGRYTLTLTAEQTALLDVLTAVWTDAEGRTTTSYVEVVGGYYFTVSEARAADRSLTADRYTDDQVRAARRDVEAEFEAICCRAFVPRYSRERVDGTGRTALLLTYPDVRAVRSVWTYSSDQTYTPFTAPQLAALYVGAAGVAERGDFAIFTYGRQNLIVEYEYGLERPPPDIKRYAFKRLRQILNETTSGVPSKALSFTAENGQSYRLATASAISTGDPDIDAALARHSARVPSIA